MTKCDRRTPLGICDVQLRTVFAALEVASHTVPWPLKGLNVRVQEMDDAFDTLPDPCASCKLRESQKPKHDNQT